MVVGRAVVGGNVDVVVVVVDVVLVDDDAEGAVRGLEVVGASAPRGAALSTGVDSAVGADESTAVSTVSSTAVSSLESSASEPSPALIDPLLINPSHR